MRPLMVDGAVRPESRPRCDATSSSDRGETPRSQAAGPRTGRPGERYGLVLVVAGVDDVPVPAPLGAVLVVPSPGLPIEPLGASVTSGATVMAGAGVVTVVVVCCTVVVPCTVRTGVTVAPGELSSPFAMMAAASAPTARARTMPTAMSQPVCRSDAACCAGWYG